ncbi:MAG: glycosyltransferase family 39 protein [Oscillospiraceae bacterium]|nr:glycosyltransferase family 39 protein [Oscillospiraceae bacterium]
MLLLNIIFIIISLCLILLRLLNRKKHNAFFNNLYEKIKLHVNKHYKILILILFILTIFTSVFKLGTVPYGLHVDEAGMAYDATSIVKYGVDRYLNHFPIYLINYGGGQSAMYAYMAALFIKIFGFSVIIIRMPAVILRVLIFVCGYFIIKNENNKLKSLTFLFLLTVVPYFIMQSRWGLDCNLLVEFLTISVCFFIQAIMKNSNKLLLVSGILFGLSLYTYALSYIIIPILLFLLCIYLLYIKKLNVKKLIILGVPVFLLAVPLILMILINNGFISEIKGIITIPLLKNYRGMEISLKNIPRSLYMLGTVFTFDGFIYNAIPYYGTIYYCTIPFFIIGFIIGLKNFYHSIKERKFNINVVFIFWFFSVVICQLLIAGPNINKANAIFVPIIYFIAIGIVGITRKTKPLILLIFLIIIINFGLFFNYYFYHYNNEMKSENLFATDYLDAIEYSKNLGGQNVYIAPNLTVQEYIYVLLNNSVSPYNYSQNNIKTTYNNIEITYTFNIPEDIDLNAVYIIGNNENLLNKFTNLGFNHTNFRELTVFYNIDKL